MLGYKRDELLRLNIRDITDPQDVAASQTQLDELARGGPEQHMKNRYLRKDAAPLPVHERVSSMRDAGGRQMSLLFLSLDQSERARKT